MRTSIISVLALAITATASSVDGYLLPREHLDDALVELYIREALAEPGFKSFIHHAEHGVGKVGKSLGHDIKKGGKFLGKHSGAIEQGVEGAASIAGSLAPYLVGRDAEPGFGSFLHKAEKDIKGAAKKTGKFLGSHKKQILHGAETGAEIAGSVAPLLMAREYELFEFDGDELAAREFDDELEARDFEEEYFW